jgi:hypothetical protein
MKSTELRKCLIPECSNELGSGAVKYCSQECTHTAQRKGGETYLDTYGTRSDAPSGVSCTTACRRTHSYRCRAEAFVVRGGVRGYVAPQFLARVLRDYYGDRCLRCGWSRRNPKTAKVPIEVEHIDGDWENNRLTNLTLLCPNCHALTPTFRALNRGRGRAYRLGSNGRPSSHASFRVASPSLIQEVFKEQSRQLVLLSPT